MDTVGAPGVFTTFVFRMLPVTKLDDADPPGAT
jgi:hypothetical protein